MVQARISRVLYLGSQQAEIKVSAKIFSLELKVPSKHI